MSTMEALYSKLYDEFKKLKTEKFSGFDNLNKDQEQKFFNYDAAAERLIQHLRNENERLLSQVHDLRSEVASIRSAKDEECTEYQELLREEKRKNKELSEEAEGLRKLQQVGNFSRLKHSKTDNGGLCTPASVQVSGEVGNRSQRRNTYKRKRHSQPETEEIVMPSISHQDDEILIGSKKELHKELVTIPIAVQQPRCCGTIEGPDGGLTPTGQANCLFQVLLEDLMHLKFTKVNQTEEIYISAVHQSSGYSFSLAWVNKGGRKEAELLYRVLSMGTLEKVAPEWMKDDLKFSTTMSHMFFEKVSRVLAG